jgi:hypothetical protein
LKQSLEKLRNEDRTLEMDEYASQRVTVLREELEAEIRHLSDKINAEKEKEAQWLVQVLKSVGEGSGIQVCMYERMYVCAF